MIIQGNKEDAIKQLIRIKSYKPFKYSGTWFLAEKGEDTVFYRTKKAIQKVNSEVYKICI